MSCAPLLLTSFPFLINVHGQGAAPPSPINCNTQLYLHTWHNSTGPFEQEFIGNTHQPTATPDLFSKNNNNKLQQLTLNMISNPKTNG